MGRTLYFADRVVRDRAAALQVRRVVVGAPPRVTPRSARRRRRAGGTRLVPVLVCALTLALGAFAGTAYAYFSAAGSGTGQASVAALQPVVVEQASVTPGALFPGERAGLSLTVKNPNDRAVTLVGVSEVGTAVTVAPATTGCTSATAGVSVTETAGSGLSDPLKASTATTGVTTLTIPTGAQMSTTSPNACQNKSFHIKVTVTVHS